ncbi:DUF484 family protein [Aliagarivorans taiwanensis]|uniref:DUF484 family protein n=1 Tax=Aliagarivorans taiwanensis TaxID=561966 RepID=UPI0004263C11|nr:DUF484 family protein [Aliagarivorans taiwanensis]
MSDFDLSQPLLTNETLIGEYLQDNPDFFARHPHLVKQLRVPHSERGAVSLVELQVQQLRSKVANLEQEITDLMTVASHNERIFKAYVDLLPPLLACDSFAELQHRLRRAIVDGLGVSQVSLRLNQDYFDLSENASECALDEERLQRFRVTRLGEEPHYFGRLSKGEIELMFDSHDQVSSVAVVPLGSQAEQGFFLAASKDADHYVEGMDSLLLTQLCQVVSGLLLRLLPLRDEL